MNVSFLTPTTTCASNCIRLAYQWNIRLLSFDYPAFHGFFIFFHLIFRVFFLQCRHQHRDCPSQIWWMKFREYSIYQTRYQIFICHHSKYRLNRWMFINVIVRRCFSATNSYFSFYSMFGPMNASFSRRRCWFWLFSFHVMRKQKACFSLISVHHDTIHFSLRLLAFLLVHWIASDSVHSDWTM